MENIMQMWAEVVLFFKAFYRYVSRRLHNWGSFFEIRKNGLVTVLVAKRGLYQRPFLHASLMVMATLAVLLYPIINAHNAKAEAQLDTFIPPSAVLASFDEQETATQVSDKPRDKVISYKVEEGDTISTIAEKFGVSVDSIKWANPTTITGEKIAINQEISVPPVTGVIHKVGKGETIYSIAKKYKVDAQNMANWPFNDFSDLDTFALEVGQLVVVPDGVMPEAKPVYSPRTIAQTPINQGSGQFGWPTQGKITQQAVSYHMALDIANNALPPVAAADGGTVSVVKRDRYGYGNHIIVTHANGYQTLYAHLSEIYVDVGQGVSKGSVIGKLGSTGRSTGPHLHFEVRQNGKLLNPLNFLK